MGQGQAKNHQSLWNPSSHPRRGRGQGLKRGMALTLPTEFLAALHALVASAHRQIVVAALYIDTNEEEVKLVDALIQAVHTHKVCDHCRDVDI